jgi:hydroxymethylbilane synthase
LRRQAQWLNRYPNHKVVDLRERQYENAETVKVDWDGAVGGSRMERINLKPTDYIDLIDDSSTSSRC